LHRVTLLAAPHAAARQPCHAGRPRCARQAWARPCRATCTGAAGLPRHPAWRSSAGSRGPARPPFFLLLSPFFSSPSRAAPTSAAAGRRPPIPAPNRWSWGGKSGGICSPRPCEGIDLLLSLLPLHCVDRSRCL
jgi:hypothetical protein